MTKKEILDILNDYENAYFSDCFCPDCGKTTEALDDRLKLRRLIFDLRKDFPVDDSKSRCDRCRKDFILLLESQTNFYDFLCPECKKIEREYLKVSKD